MIYRLMLRSDSEDGGSEIVLTQKIKNFNPAFAAAISISGVLKKGSPLFEAALFDEMDIEFEKGQIAQIGNAGLENVLDFDRDFTINLRFLSADSSSLNFLNAEVIE